MSKCNYRPCRVLCMVHPLTEHFYMQGFLFLIQDSRFEKGLFDYNVEVTFVSAPNHT